MILLKVEDMSLPYIVETRRLKVTFDGAVVEDKKYVIVKIELKEAIEPKDAFEFVQIFKEYERQIEDAISRTIGTLDLSRAYFVLSGRAPIWLYNIVASVLSWLGVSNYRKCVFDPKLQKAICLEEALEIPQELLQKLL